MVAKYEIVATIIVQSYYEIAILGGLLLGNRYEEVGSNYVSLFSQAIRLRACESGANSAGILKLSSV